LRALRFCDWVLSHSDLRVNVTARFDIVICSGRAQVSKLRQLLPRVAPFGTVHLASSYLEPGQFEQLRPWVDVLHEPRHHPDGYQNFNLFCIRDLNWIGEAPYFIKLDTDVELAEDWIDYVEESLGAHPDAILIGTHAGSNKIDYDVSGPLVRRKLGGDLRVRNGLKVNGSFYVGQTSFFREHDDTMQTLHDFIYAFKDGHRIRPRHTGSDPAEGTGVEAAVNMRGVCALRAGTACEDNVRCLTAHHVGAGKRLRVIDPKGRVRVWDKVKSPRRWKLAKKWLRSRAGVSWSSTKKPSQ